MTPLHYAAKVHALDCVTILLDLNADPMARSSVRFNVCTVYSNAELNILSPKIGQQYAVAFGGQKLSCAHGARIIQKVVRLHYSPDSSRGL
jgi:hypothetical protein